MWSRGSDDLLHYLRFCFLYIFHSSFCIRLGLCEHSEPLHSHSLFFLCLSMNQYQSSEYVVDSSLTVDPFLHDTASAVCTMWLDTANFHLQCWRLNFAVCHCCDG
jgi:hypothetical protein